MEPGEGPVLDFLTDILVGDTTWTLGEVQNLLALHTLVALGHGQAEGLHDGQAAALRGWAGESATAND